MLIKQIDAFLSTNHAADNSLAGNLDLHVYKHRICGVNVLFYARITIRTMTRIIKELRNTNPCVIDAQIEFCDPSDRHKNRIGWVREER